MTISIVTTLVEDLKEDMVLADSVYDHDGNLLLLEDAVLTMPFIKKLNDMGILSVKIKTHAYKTSKERKEELAKTGHVAIPKYDPESEECKVIVEESKNDAIEMMEDIMGRLSINSKIDTDKLYLVVSQLVNEILSNDEIVFNLANLRSVDDYIFQHSVNVCVMSIVTGIMLGFNKVRLVNLGIGALLHDIGKVYIPDEIINKPDKLTYDEFDIIKTHSVKGFISLNEVKNISVDAKAAILKHHERVDGTGYPNGEKGDAIHIFAKIVGIADVFDAITSEKVYAPKEDPYFAMQCVLNDASTKYDMEIVKIFIKAIGFYPLGLAVHLNNNEYGIIIKKNRDKPLVRILVDDKNMILNYNYEIDLAKNPSIKIIDIDPTKQKIAMLKKELSV